MHALMAGSIRNNSSSAPVSPEPQRGIYFGPGGKIGTKPAKQRFFTIFASDYSTITQRT